MLVMTFGSHVPRDSTGLVWAAFNVLVAAGLTAFTVWIDSANGVNAPVLVLVAYVLGNLRGKTGETVLRGRDYRAALSVAARWAGIDLGGDGSRALALKSDMSQAYRVHQLPAEWEKEDEHGSGDR